MLGANGTRPPKGWKKVFLKALARAPFVIHACRAARVSSPTVYKARSDDESFKKKWDAAVDEAWENMDRRHYDISLHGTKRGVWKTKNGKPIKVEVITEYDLSNMWKRLQNHYPQYRDTSRIEHVGSADGPPVQIQQIPPLVPKDLEDGV